LLRRISQIHITEEARHLSFARLFLRRNVPRLGVLKRRMLQLRTPLILGQMSQQMMQPSAQIVARYSIPHQVIERAYRNNPEHHARTAEAVGKVRALCQELGIATSTTAPLWRAFHLWPAEAAA
jgi:hypothetical protein